MLTGTIPLGMNKIRELLEGYEDPEAWAAKSIGSIAPEGSGRGREEAEEKGERGEPSLTVRSLNALGAAKRLTLTQTNNSAEDVHLREGDRRHSLKTMTGEEDGSSIDATHSQGDLEEAQVEEGECAHQQRTLQVRMDSTREVEPEILWCNGRCMGRADTSGCTFLCLGEWETKVRTTQHQLAIKQIIERHHHSDLVMQPIEMVRGFVDYNNSLAADPLFEHLAAPTGQVELLSIKPTHDVKKHPRETLEQYKWRQVRRVREEREGRRQGGEGRDELMGDIKIMRRIFRKRRQEKRRKTLIVAIITLRRFMRYCIKWLRERRREMSATTIVRYVRGFLTRVQVPELLEERFADLRRKTCALVRIRNFLRRCAREMRDSIWCGPSTIPLHPHPHPSPLNPSPSPSPSPSLLQGTDPWRRVGARGLYWRRSRSCVTKGHVARCRLRSPRPCSPPR